MQACYRFYMDDSGTRKFTNKGVDPCVKRDYFALGGVIVNENDEAKIRDAHSAFCNRWNISAPLHSWEIRNKTENFTWLSNLSDEDRGRFLGELEGLLFSCPMVAHACVIHRPGYHARYSEYGEERWNLCKTAFSVSTERAAKYASQRNARLRVYAERSTSVQESLLLGYYEDMRARGMPFNANNSGQYAPLSNDDLRKTLFEFRIKQKTSPIMQLADLMLYPLCRGRYDPEYRPYVNMIKSKKIIDCIIPKDRIGIEGVKYSCFDGI